MAKRPTRLRFTEDDLSSDAVKKAAGKAEKAAAKAEKAVDKITPKTVSYTHLTLPTIRLV